MSDDYVYYESNWFSEVKRNNDNLMWRYWAAKEMAKEIQYEQYPMNNYYGGNFYFKESKFIGNLAQILKKEWFR